MKSRKAIAIRSLLLGTLLLLAGIVTGGCGPEEGGVYRVSWNVNQGGESSSCREAGARTVGVVFREVGVETSNESKFSFGCEDLEGETGILPVGYYTIEATLYSDNKTALDTAGPFAVDPILVDGAVVTLPAIFFAVE
ncbi:MAG: hypothetical protein V2A73_19610 [Pseudomonadota bacterium]